MPDTGGMNLQEAEDAVNAASNGVPLQMHSAQPQGHEAEAAEPGRLAGVRSGARRGREITSATDVNFGVVREFDAARNTWDDMVSKACD